MMPFNVLSDFLPEESQFLYNTTASFIDPLTLSYNNKIFMYYDGNVPRHTYSDIYYYINNLSRYNILKKDLKHIQFLPIYTYNKTNIDNFISNENLVIKNKLLFIQNSTQHILPEYIQHTNIDNINIKDLYNLDTKYEFAFYDTRFEYPYRTEFLFILFFKFSKIYLQTTYIDINNLCSDLDFDIMYLFQNIFNLKFEKINNECWLINTDKMNLDNYKLFLVMNNNIRKKIVDMILNVEMPNFNNYDDILLFYKEVERIVD